MSALEIIVAVLLLSVNGGAILALWSWIRTELIKLDNITSSTKADVESIKARCQERAKNYDRSYELISDLTGTVQVTARNVVKLAQAQGIQVENP